MTLNPRAAADFLYLDRGGIEEDSFQATGSVVL